MRVLRNLAVYCISLLSSLVLSFLCLRLLARRRGFCRAPWPIVETFVPVPILDGLVPQMVDQLVDVLRIFDTMLLVVAEQVTGVPKIILQDSIPQLEQTSIVV